MTYEDLPYSYRSYAERHEWPEDQALEYWRQGDKYRAYAIAMTLSVANDSVLNPELTAIDLLRRTIHHLRGTATWLT